MLLQTSLVFVLTLLLNLTKGSEQAGDPGCAEECKPDCEENGDHCYYWSTVSKNWDEAEEFCKGEGAHLASVTSEANEYIEAELKQGNRHLLIGGSDKESEGTWKWSDGSTWEFTNWGTIAGKEQ